MKKDLTKSMGDLSNLKEKAAKGPHIASASKLVAGKDQRLHCEAFFNVNNHEKWELAEHLQTDASFVRC